MGQPEIQTKETAKAAFNTQSIKDDTNTYTQENPPNPRLERYFRCSVSTHANESAWIFVHDTIHTPIRFHREYEVVLPEWAIEILRNTKIRQMVAKFAPFQKSVPYFPRITRRYIPEIIEEVSYQDYVNFRDNDAERPLPDPGEAGSSSRIE